ncbi:uncharacterized protein N7496_008989 [Penicillium cataractarum]|uniref:Uncharacterized protein n=1 Tax=Penicillium cataractarum TaxID=2100454 RepID=A0A9W9S251_9EURO|nr:uncharacterized protein N7496_008989 [Penicillium cataractarum]KAJ5369229.1 hypothetical protein N7496_008989 [Penicillium cataractarum]
MKNDPILGQGLHYEFRNLVSLESEAFTPSAPPELLEGACTTSVVPLSLPIIHSLRAVREAISIATRIHFAALVCVQLLLDRLSVAEPRRVVGPPSKAYEWVRRKLPEPQNEPIRFKYHPPSWAEIYRANRILWILATFNCVHHAANIRWSWSSEEINSFTKQYVQECWLKWRLEELKTIAECLAVMYPSDTVILDHCFPFLVTIPSPEKSIAPAQLFVPPPPNGTDQDKDWERIRAMAGRKNHIIGKYRFMCGFFRDVRHTLFYVKFQAFRRVGAPIWDN